MFLLQRRLLTPKLNSSLIPRDNETYYSQKQSKQNTESKTDQNNRAPSNAVLKPILQNLDTKFVAQVKKKIVKQQPDRSLQWHKKSVSMKMRNINLKTSRRMIQGQLIKYRKGQDIYAFRCVKDQPKLRQTKQLAQDHDITTDDEQIFIACKNMFLSLCQGLQNELFSSDDNTIEDFDL